MEHDLPKSFEEARRQCSILGVSLAEESFRQIGTFLDLLENASGRTNLVGPEETGRLWTRHVLESMAFIPFLDCREVIDIGTGGGFPGIILGLCGYSVTMVESRRKRCAFLETAVRTCGITAGIVNNRIEEAGPFPDGSVFTSRAVKKPQSMVDLIIQAATGDFRLVTRVSSSSETCSNAVISKELPVPPLDRSGFILQYRRSGTKNKVER